MTHLVYNNLLSNFPNVKSLLDNTFKNDENKKRLVCCYCSADPEKELAILTKYFNISNIIDNILEWLSTNLIEYQSDWTKLRVKKYMERR